MLSDGDSIIIIVFLTLLSIIMFVSAARKWRYLGGSWLLALVFYVLPSPGVGIEIFLQGKLWQPFLPIWYAAAVGDVVLGLWFLRLAMKHQEETNDI